MNNHRGKAEFINFRILLDNGISSKTVMNNLLYSLSIVMITCKTIVDNIIS